MKAVVGVSLLLVLALIACNGERGEGSCSAAASPRQASVHEERRDAPPPPAASAPTAANASAVTTTRSHAAESCGELAMTRVGLIEEGRGENHPEVVGVDALLAQCTDKTPSPDACRRVTNELTEKTAGGYGPNHPRVRSLRAKQALCPK